jgi:26S proteasome regulatory subunit N6
MAAAGEGEKMEVEPVLPTATAQDNDEDEEDCSDLADLLESVDDAASASGEKSASDKIAALTSILSEPLGRYGPSACAIKERAVYALARAYCVDDRHGEVVTLLTGTTCAPFFANVTKAKTAKVVRAVLDAVCALAPSELEMQAQICRNIVSWCVAERRTFLRQRVEAKLASVLFQQDKYSESLALLDNLLLELKKLDDKTLLVEVHLVESKVHHGLRGMAKAKAALTASRTNANAVYVAPALQSQIDLMSGVLHCEEGDYDTAHSYFLEAFEQLDQLDDREKAVPCLKYIMLCSILDGLSKALGISATGATGIRSDKSAADISGMVSGRRGVKYAGSDVDAMSAIAAAASRRSLREYEAVIARYPRELQDDLLIKHHLGTLQEQLLESNLIRIIEPYSCVEIEHVAKLIDMPLRVVERKLSQMILDGKFHGILDQGKGQLIVYEDAGMDKAMEKGLKVVENMDKVVTSLFSRSHNLRSMMV